MLDWRVQEGAAKHRCQSSLHAIKASLDGRVHMELQKHKALAACCAAAQGRHGLLEAACSGQTDLPAGCASHRLTCQQMAELKQACCGFNS